MEIINKEIQKDSNQERKQYQNIIIGTGNNIKKKHQIEGISKADHETIAHTLAVAGIIGKELSYAIATAYGYKTPVSLAASPYENDDTYQLLFSLLLEKYRQEGHGFIHPYKNLHRIYELVDRKFSQSIRRIYL